ncbi:MAG TPA: hypothetical protein VIK84_05715 [Haloplasmataceae bacterium]
MKELTKKLQAQFNKMCQTGKLFRVALTGQYIWELYLNSFESDPVFRDPSSSTHNCNHCKNFIRRYGNIVAVDESYNIITLFDVEIEGEFAPVVEALSNAIKSSNISDVFFETFNELNSLPYESCSKTNSVFRLGIEKNVKRYTREEAEKFGVVRPNEIRTFNHLYLDLPKEFVDMSGKSIEAIMADYRDAKNVFQRAMETISIDTLLLVRDLINQGSLLDGQTHLYKIEQIIPLKQEYDNLAKVGKDEWCWVKSHKLPYAKFRNELIGVLCSELSEGMDLNEACKNWNKRIDPANYMKATAPITKNQIEEARKFVEENGYEESFNRRFATIDDINISEILHANVGKGEIKNASIFDNVKSTSTRHKRSEFDKVEEVSIEKFMQDILPNCTSVEAFLTNQHEGNMVSLTTANNPDSKPIFKWSNNYSWTFNGNLAGKSQIKEAVKSRGGKTEGVLRISLAFPDTTDDYDLHLVEPTGGHIYYGNLRMIHSSSGILDLDAQGIDGHQPSEKRVENIIYTDKNKMSKGAYKVSVHNYSGRGFHTPFLIEIEHDDDVTTLKLKIKSSRNTLEVATIHFNGNNFETLLSDNMEVVESKTISKEIYGLQTNEFHKVNLVCLSPNYWGENNVGNKHYFFMLDGCKTRQPIRSFHNENLNADLVQHRKVMEVLGATNMIEPTDKQLSGIGFNATVRDELIVKLSGNFKRVIKIKF